MPPAALATDLSITLKVSAAPFGGQALFKPFEITFPARRWTCLLGASGCGKSTILRMIAGLHKGPTDSYHLHLSGEDTLSSQVSFMAQHDLLMPWRSALDNIVVGDHLRGNAPDLERARTLLAAVGMADYCHSRPDRLSGGQRQRIALVRTLYEDRPVVLMDEPFSALDPLTRLKLQDLAAEMLTGRTVVLVTHDPLEALRLADHIVVLSGNPASPAPALCPSGPRPRPVTEPSVMTLHGHLLAQLGHQE